MRRTGLLFLAAIAVMSFSGCENKNDNTAVTTTVLTTTETGSVDETTTIMDEKANKAFTKEKEKYEKYIKEHYNGEPVADSETIFSYNVEEDGKTIAGLGLIFYSDKEKADKYMDFMTKSFPEERRSKYDMGDDSVVYTPDDEHKDSEGNKLPIYIIVRSGDYIWTTFYYDGHEKDAKDFLDSMIEE